MNKQKKLILGILGLQIVVTLGLMVGLVVKNQESKTLNNQARSETVINMEMKDERELSESKLVPEKSTTPPDTKPDKSTNQSESKPLVQIKSNDQPQFNVQPKPAGTTYFIRVARKQNVVMVYGQDEKGNHSKLEKVFLASTGKDNATPLGTFTIPKGARWRWAYLFGNVYGQYAVRINGYYLFHSVPYFTRNVADLEWQEYNKLGEQASLGCVRMAVEDAKWIYDYVADGARVEIFDGPLPEGVIKPVRAKILENDSRKGWDPTDPDLANPWKK